MSVNPAPSDHPDVSQQPNVDPEGTIIDWLRREAALEKAFPYLKRKRSDGQRSTDSSSTSSTPSSSAIDYETEEIQDLDPFEENVYPSMAANPASGPRADGDAQSTTSDTVTADPSAAAPPTAPTSEPPQQPAIKIPTDPQWVTARLEGYRLYQDDEEAFTKYPKFQEQVKNILKQKRKSSIDQFEFSEFRLVWQEYKDKNEDTVLNELLPFFMNDKRTISINSTAEEEDAYAVVSYFRSGLVKITNREFHRACLPLREDGSPLNKKLLDAMAKEDGMTNPKPDRTFGISMKKSTLPKGFITPPDIAVWLEVMRGIHHPFFLIEGKSYQGNLLDAQNEACRGGATLVGAARRLLATLGIPNMIGADTRT
ncbi:MAG: hypothetical protein Q9184_007650, partial [Pyrenodesmia sp. 2 TL-2023]